MTHWILLVVMIAGQGHAPAPRSNLGAPIYVGTVAMKRIQYIVTIDFEDPNEGSDAEAELLDAVADIGCYHQVKIEAAYDRTIEIGEPIRGKPR